MISCAPRIAGGRGRETEGASVASEENAGTGRPGGGQGPESFARRVLLTVAGLTPQIVTETVYALAVRRRPPFVPTRIVVVTTTEGASRVRLMLQGENPGWLARMCDEYGLPPIALAEADIVTLKDRAGGPLSDIRTDSDNADAADTIIEVVRGLTADAGCAVHASIAGGRKTLGFFAGYALSLYGRPQDRLSHVLVSSRFESNQGLYYPAREPRIIFGPPPGNEPLDAATAEVTLADIPFVRMREGLSDALRRGRTTYSAAVEALQRRLGPPSLVIDLPRRLVIAGGIEVPLEPAIVAFYAWAVRHSLADDPVRRPGNRDVPDLAYAQEYLASYAKTQASGTNPALATRLRKGMDQEFFDQHASKLRKVFQDRLDTSAGFYVVKRSGGRGKSVYGIDVPADAIAIIEQEVR